MRAHATMKPLAFGMLAMTCALGMPAAAQDRAAVTLELSAQQLNVPPQNQQQQQQQRRNAPQAQPRQAPQAPRQAVPRQGPPPQVRRAPPPPQVRQGPPPPPRQVQPRPPAGTTPVPRVVNPGTPRGITSPQPNRNVVAPRAPGATPRVATPRTPRAPRTVTLRGPRSGVVTTTRLRTAPARGVGRASIRGRSYSVWRGGHRVRYRSGWRTFVALSALSAIVIGGSQFYPYAYISAPEPYCDGLTEDGCRLVWDEVETDEGDIVPQCVAYCPWQ